MKRIKNTWQNVISEENGVGAVVDGTVYKKNQREVQPLLKTDPDHYHEIDREKAREYVKPIIAELKDHTYQHGVPRSKKQFCKNKSKSKGKWRDLYIPSLKDHIVAHMVMNANMKAFMRGMYPHCCGSVPNRGINHVIKTVRRWVVNDKELRYFVKLDIRKFFRSYRPGYLKGEIA